MTPVREALEEVRAFMKVDIGNGDSDLWTAEYRALWDTVNEALSAAPGEPCAVKPLEWSNNPPPVHEDNPFSHWAAGIGGHYHAEHDGTLWMAHDGFVWEKYETQEAAKAAAQADHEQRIRFALVTTPQPAAGWDEAAGYAERLAVVLWEKHFKSDAPQWKPLSGDLIGLLTQIDNMTTSLRREAPAPAEGKGTSVTEDQIKHMVDRFLGWKLPENFNPDGGVSFKRLPNRHHHPDAPPFYPMPTGTNLFDAIQATEMVRYMIDGLPARPDTAEARLREALNDISTAETMLSTHIEAFHDFDYAPHEVPLEVSSLRNIQHHLAGSLIDENGNALSPPSGGDEAKESEGGTFQSRVQPWMMACFGPEISADRTERNHRFLEEALELVQSNGCTPDEAHQLVDYVYGRPQGEINQEVGGVMVTLAALCLANGIDMHKGGETELARVWTKVEQIRAKQAAKPKHSPLPGPSEPLVGRREEQLRIQALGAAISRRDWHAAERAYEIIRDKFDRPSEPSPPADRREIVARIERMICEGLGYEPPEKWMPDSRANRLTPLAQRLAALDENYKNSNKA